MWLWHGTYDMYYQDILNCGKLKINNGNQDTISMILDGLINGTARCQIRGNCLYLSNSIECMDAFDKSFRVNTNDLDTRKLFVANNGLLSYIIGYRNANGSLCDKYIAEYLKSYITFEQYLKVRKQYDLQCNPEFLYYDDIKLDRKK